MYEDNKGLRILRKVYVAIFIIAVIVNLVLSKVLGIVNYIAIFVWMYGVLCYLGVIKKIESKENNKIVYSTSIPIFQVVLLRVAQILLWKLLHFGMKDGQVIPFFVCCFIDIILIILAVVDSGSYYYESIIEQSQDDHSVVTVENKES